MPVSSEKSDELIISEAIRLVGEGIEVTFPVRGRSMLPFIVGGRDSVVLTKPSEVKALDVVLAWVGDHYVVHRVLSVEGTSVTLMGDGNLVGREYCDVSGIRALATHVVDGKGRRHNLNSSFRLFAVKLWMCLRPVRKWLLLFYRILEKLRLV